MPARKGACYRGGMLRFDHFRLAVADLGRSRRWYVDTLGMKVEFEMPDRKSVALQDTEGFTMFIQESQPPAGADACAVWFQVADVDATFRDWSARGIEFAHPPRKNFWGYGAELTDPDGHPVRLWDERTMKEK